MGSETLDKYIEKYKSLHHGGDFITADREGETRTVADSKGKIFDGSNFAEKLMLPLDKHLADKQSVTVLDYGCGKAKHLYTRRNELDKKTFHERYNGKIQSYYCYDPGYAPYSTPPQKGSNFDIILCADVMEHIPEECVPEVFRHMESLLHPAGTAFFSIAASRAYKSFPDGENLHCTVQPFEWWNEQMKLHLRRRTYTVHSTFDFATRSTKTKIFRRE